MGITARREGYPAGSPDGQGGRGSSGGENVNLPILSPSDFERLLQHLLSARGMDVDDAMDWIEDHYDVKAVNERASKNR